MENYATWPPDAQEALDSLGLKARMYRLMLNTIDGHRPPASYPLELQESLFPLRWLITHRGRPLCAFGEMDGTALWTGFVEGLAFPIQAARDLDEAMERAERFANWWLHEEEEDEKLQLCKPAAAALGANGKPHAMKGFRPLRRQGAGR